jgi:putative phage-type endonuclease
MTTTEERRAQWLAERRTCITATDVAKIMGVSKFGGPADVFFDKVGVSEDTPPTQAMESGHRLQDAILRWYADKEGCPIQLCDPFTVYRNPDYPLLGASLDGLREPDGIPVDAKNVRFLRFNDGWGEQGTDEVPPDYLLQLHVQAMICDKDHADLSVLASGQDHMIFRVPVDPVVSEAIVEAADRFWTNHVIPRIPPSIDASEGWSRYLAQKFSSHGPAMIDAGPEFLQIVSAFREADAMVELWTRRLDEAKNKIRAAIGEFAGIRGTWGQFTWKKSADAVKVDRQAVIDDLTAAFPEVARASIARHTSMQPGSRRLLDKLKEV